MLRLRPLQAVCGAVSRLAAARGPGRGCRRGRSTRRPTSGTSTPPMASVSRRREWATAACARRSTRRTTTAPSRTRSGSRPASARSARAPCSRSPRQVTIDGNGSGPGADDTIVDGGDAVQLFSVGSTASVVTFSDLRLQNGFLDAPVSGAGAALRTDAPATLLDSVVITRQRDRRPRRRAGRRCLRERWRRHPDRREQRHQRQRDHLRRRQQRSAASPATRDW